MANGPGVPSEVFSLLSQKVLVTGGAGFIGSHLSARLVALGTEVHILDDLSTGSLVDAHRSGVPEARIHICDIRRRAARDLIIGIRPDVVIHLAAQTSLSRAEMVPLQDADINVRGSINLLEACLEADVGHVVHAASCAIYGGMAAGDPPVGEETEPRPVGRYGVSKLNSMRGMAPIHPTALVLGNVYGPRPAQDEAGVIVRMADAALRGVPPVIFGDGRQTRDFVHIQDVVDAILSSCVTRRSGMYNIGSGAETSVNDVLAIVRQATGARQRPVHLAARGGDIDRMVLDIRKARDELGWSARIGLREGIGGIVAMMSRRPAMIREQDPEIFLAG